MNNTIVCPIYKNTCNNGDQPAIISNDAVVTYSEFNNSIEAAFYTLKNLGIKSGDRVAIISPNNSDFLIALAALWRLKAIACPISTRLPAKAMEEAAQHVGSTHVLKKDELQKISNTINREESINATPKISLDQDATILFTSGSSSKPKAALHTFGNHYFSAMASNEHLPVNQNDRWLLSLPLYHVGGLAILFRICLKGAAIVIPDDSRNMVEDIKNHNVTHCSFVPTQLYRLLQDKESIKILKTLKVILLGGARIPGSLLQKAIEYALPIFITYGLTEMSSQVATSGRVENDREASLARILKNCELKIGQNEEIYVKGKTLFQGYIKESTIERPFDESGWFNTGDLGQIVDKKYLKVIGRKDNMFTSGGENIQPEEIEQCLLEIHGVEDSLVVPIPHAEFGYRPIALIRYNERQKISDATLRKSLANILPKFKIPDQFYQWPTINGEEERKLNRNQLMRSIYKNQIHLEPINPI